MYGHIRCIYTVLAKTIYIRCIYGIFGREITKYTVIYGVYIRFWPTLVPTHVEFGSNWLSPKNGRPSSSTFSITCACMCVCVYVCVCVQVSRDETIQCFRFGVTPVMVATGIASRGLDVPDIAHVVNFDMPFDIHEYVYRWGVACHS